MPVRSLLILPFVFCVLLIAQDQIEAEFLYNYLAGDYHLITKDIGSENTQFGTVKIVSQATFFEVQRTLNGRTVTGIGVLDYAGPDRIPFLKITYKDSEDEFEGSYLWKSDFDNYARISGYVYYPGKNTEDPGMEVMFINHKPEEIKEKEDFKMIRGLRTVKYGVSDISKGKEWYTKALGFGPYFDEPFYVGFNVDGYELGLDPDTPPSQSADAGVVAYWGVKEIEIEYERLLSIGAKPHSPVQDVGGGIKVATVLDPFGNVFGIIYNPHFKKE